MRAIQQLMPTALSEQLRSGPLSPAKLEFAWRTAVGPAVGRATAVALDGTTLIVEPASAQWAQEVARVAPQILARLQGLVGADIITQVRVRGLVTRRRRASRRAAPDLLS